MSIDQRAGVGVAEPPAIPQWRAERIQLVNWGGFDGYTSIGLSPGATLIAGATGSGKSTILDAYLALMMDSNTPFNGASNDATIGRARSKEQRSLLTYLRGKLDDVTADDEDTVRVLRGSRSWIWGAIAVTFADADGSRFSAVRLYHVPRDTTIDSEIGKKLCTVEGPVDLREFEDLAESKFDKRMLEARFGNLKVRKSYERFAATLHARLGIGAHGDGTNALRLLSRIQAGKAMPTVDALFKTMVLEQPSTYRNAEAAVAHFASLETSYAEMLTAQRKQTVLGGIPEAWDAREGHLRTIEAVDGLDIGRNEDSPFAHWAATAELDQLQAALVENGLELQAARELLRRSEKALAEARTQHSLLDDAWRAAGGGTLDELEQHVERLRAQLEDVERALGEFSERTSMLDLDIRSEDELLAAQTASREFTEVGYFGVAKDLTARRDTINQDLLGPLRREREALVNEARSLRGREGRVPVAMHEARVAAAEATGLRPSDLPFVAELIDIAPDEDEWRDAAELALRPVTTIMLVDAAKIEALSVAIDRLDWGVRLNFDGVDLRSPEPVDLDPLMLSGKLIYKATPFTWWIQNRITQANIDALCVRGPEQLSGPGRRVTTSGQMRHGRRGAHGRTGAAAIIGFDNKSRLGEIAAQIEKVDSAISKEQVALERLQARSNTLTDLRDAHRWVLDTAWPDIDAATIDARINEGEERRQRILDSDDRLGELTAQVADAVTAENNAHGDQIRADDRVNGLEAAGERLRGRAIQLDDQLDLLAQRGRSHTPEQSDLLAEILADEMEDVAYDPETFATRLVKVAGVLRDRRTAAEGGAKSAAGTLVRAFVSFQDQWPDPNLGTGVESYPDYLEILNGITIAGLHDKREQWAQRVAAWTGDDLLPLHLAFESAIDDIRSRLAPVNDILATLPFGAHRDRLRIDLRQLHREEHARFRKTLKELSSGVTANVTFDDIEARFVRLQTFMDHIRPGAGSGDQSRDYYLDVRQHLELSALVIEKDGNVRAKFTSLGGKSGGETQELAAFIVGAALRYQLGDERRPKPRFAPVFLDEGFVKSDSEFAGRSVRAWKGLGFQLVIATAFGTVSALEPHMELLMQVTKNPLTGRSRVHDLVGPSE